MKIYGGHWPIKLLHWPKCNLRPGSPFPSEKFEGRRSIHAHWRNSLEDLVPIVCKLQNLRILPSFAAERHAGWLNLAACYNLAVRRKLLLLQSFGSNPRNCFISLETPLLRQTVFLPSHFFDLGPVWTCSSPTSSRKKEFFFLIITANYKE